MHSSRSADDGREGTSGGLPGNGAVRPRIADGAVAVTTGLRARLRTADVDEARTTIGSVYCPHQLRPLHGAGAFRAQYVEGGCEELAVHFLEYGAEVLVDPVPLDRYVLVSRPTRGRLEVHSGGEDRVVRPGETVVLDPYRDFTLRWEQGCRLLTLRLDRSAVESALAHVLGVETPVPPRFGLEGAASPEAGRVWAGMTDLVVRDADTGGHLLANRLLRPRIQEAMVAALVETHPFDPGPASPGTPGRVLPRAVRRAVAYAERAADHEVTLADLAAHARLSPRALLDAYRRHLGTTPMAHLRQVRLRRAHDDLLAADPAAGATVTEIAYRWGFGNLGRFAARYRETYGRAPHETLRE